MAEELKFKKGDIVDFIGKKHYTRPGGKVYFTVKPGVAKIDAVMHNGIEHPYHLIPADKETTVHGWVDEDEIAGIHKKEVKIKSISFRNSKSVRIAFAENTERDVVVSSSNWNDQEWIAVFRPRDPEDAEKFAHMAEVACVKKTFNEKARIFKTTFIEIMGYATGIELPETITIKSMIQSGLFHCFVSDYYTKEDTYLRRGDILLGANNSAVVLSNGKESKKQMPFK